VIEEVRDVGVCPFSVCNDFTVKEVRVEVLKGCSIRVPVIIVFKLGGNRWIIFFM